MKKKILIGLGLLAAAGIGYYFWKKNEADEKEADENKPDDKKANASGNRKYDSTSPPVNRNTTS